MTDLPVGMSVRLRPTPSCQNYGIISIRILYTIYFGGRARGGRGAGRGHVTCYSNYDTVILYNCVDLIEEYNAKRGAKAPRYLRQCFSQCLLNELYDMNTNNITSVVNK